MSNQVTGQKVGVNIGVGLLPTEPQSVKVSLNMGTAPFISPYVINFQDALYNGVIDFIQSIYVDNSLNAAPVSVTSNLTLQTLTIPPYTQAILPILAVPQAAEFTVVTTGSAPVDLQFMSVMMPAQMWSVNGELISALDVNGNIQVVSPTNPLPIYDGYTQPQTQTWNSGTVLNTVLSISTLGMDTVLLTYVPSGSITGGVVTFEGYDGANWQILRGTITNGYTTYSTYNLTTGQTALQFDVAAFQQFRARLSTVISGTGSALMTVLSSSAPSFSLVAVGFDPSSSLPSGNNTIGAVFSVGSSNGNGGNLTCYRLSSAATTNATSVKSTPGVLYGGQIVNTGTSNAYLKLYNKTTAPTVGTDTPVITLTLPAQVTGTDIVPINLPDILGQIGYKFANGIALAITGAYADTDTTAVAAGQVNINLFYN